MDDRIDAIHLKLGELSGTQKTQGDLLREISVAVSTLASTISKIEGVLNTQVQHDKRICAMEQELTLRGAQIDDLRDHVENDVPIHTYTGDLAKKILLVCGGAGGVWFLEKIPKIIAVLGRL